MLAVGIKGCNEKNVASLKMSYIVAKYANLVAQSP